MGFYCPPLGPWCPCLTCMGWNGSTFTFRSWRWNKCLQHCVVLVLSINLTVSGPAGEAASTSGWVGPKRGKGKGQETKRASQQKFSGGENQSSPASRHGCYEAPDSRWWEVPQSPGMSLPTKFPPVCSLFSDFIENMRQVVEIFLKYGLVKNYNHIGSQVKDKELYDDCDTVVKRQMWKDNQSLFGDEVSPLLSQYIREKEILLFDQTNLNNPFFLPSPKVSVAKRISDFLSWAWS